MTFEEAMLKSDELKMDALEAIALRLPNSRKALNAYIQFNPYVYLFWEKP